jgi:hypothetical protein
MGVNAAELTRSLGAWFTDQRTGRRAHPAMSCQHAHNGVALLSRPFAGTDELTFRYLIVYPQLMPDVQHEWRALADDRPLAPKHEMHWRTSATDIGE